MAVGPDPSLLLWPLRWAIEDVLASAHSYLTGLRLPPSGGITWLIAVMLLVVLLRLLVLPLTISAAKNAQQLEPLTTEIVRIRAAYKGQHGAAARERQKAEIRAVRQTSKANQLKSAIPQLLQVPIFTALYAVLRSAQNGHEGVGPLTAPLARSFGHASIFGVPLTGSLLDSHGSLRVGLVCASLTFVVASTQFVAQAMSLRFNVTDVARQSPIWKYRPTPLFFAPVILTITSLAIPAGLLFYLAASSMWTLGQQLFLLWHYPLPTTAAHDARERRQQPHSSRLDCRRPA